MARLGRIGRDRDGQAGPHSVAVGVGNERADVRLEPAAARELDLEMEVVLVAIAGDMARRAGREDRRPADEPAPGEVVLGRVPGPDRRDPLPNREAGGQGDRRRDGEGREPQR